jgi:hypothetical protein
MNETGKGTCCVIPPDLDSHRVISLTPHPGQSTSTGPTWREGVAIW